MTVFQHTLEQVLSGDKCQTSRLWNADNWQISAYRDSGNGMQISEISSIAENKYGKIRKLYYVGQTLSVQPARGQKGVAKIRVLELAKRDVRTYDTDEWEDEGFPTDPDGFYAVWCEMHDKPVYNAHPRQHSLSYKDLMFNRPLERYLALLIKFELVDKDESQSN